MGCGNRALIGARPPWRRAGRDLSRGRGVLFLGADGVAAGLGRQVRRGKSHARFTRWRTGSRLSGDGRRVLPLGAPTDRAAWDREPRGIAHSIIDNADAVLPMIDNACSLVGDDGTAPVWDSK